MLRLARVLVIGHAAAELCTEPGSGEWVSAVCESRGNGKAAEHIVTKQTTIEACTVYPVSGIKSSCVAGASDIVGKDTGSIDEGF
jgi:hypothetical protein